MQTFAYIWFEYRAAQQRVRETFAQSPLPDEQPRLNSSAIAQPGGEIAGREVERISPEATDKDRGISCWVESLRLGSWTRKW